MLESEELKANGMNASPHNSKAKKFGVIQCYIMALRTSGKCKDRQQRAAFFFGGGKWSHEREDMGHEGTGHGTAASETITALLG